MPLRAQGAVIGVVQLLNPVGRDRFTAGDLWRMRQFAAILAPTLQNARLWAAQRRQFFHMVTALAEALEKRDPYTGGHVRRVVAYSLLLGAEMGLSPRGAARPAARRHPARRRQDRRRPTAILGKPAPLDAEEVEIMRRHAARRRLDRLAPRQPWVLHGVRSHHERMDGKGYPDGLADAEIPLAARIIAVADTYDAMTTSRPYRAGLPPERAAAEIQPAPAASSARGWWPRSAASSRRGRFRLERAEARDVTDGKDCKASVLAVLGVR